MDDYDDDDEDVGMDRELIIREISDILSTLIKIEVHIESGNKPYNDEFDLCFLEDVKYSLSDVLSRWE